LLVLLPPRGAEPDDVLSDGLFRELERLGARAPTIVIPSGGGQGAFHDKPSGRWGSYVLREVVPRARRDLQADGRTAIGGFSTGGLGALDLARERRFCAVGAHSPALWRSEKEAPNGFFDGPADFRRHGLRGLERDQLQTDALSIDTGASDRFRPEARSLARRLGVRLRGWAGRHDQAYWDRHIGAYLQFYAAALARC
jgi:S-formylglutathione hydrolase FrmB